MPLRPKVEVRLGPETNLHTLLAGVVAKALQVGDVAVERAGLSVACAVTIVGQHPSEWHVGVEIAVDDGASRELVVVLLAVEALLDATVVFLALGVALAVLEEDAAVGVVGFLPVVAVVSVEVTLVEGELRQQHRVAGELVVVVEQLYGTLVHHDKHVHVRCVVADRHLALARLAEVVGALLEGVAHHGVAACRPIERGG